jgi:hypothetical protein
VKPLAKSKLRNIKERIDYANSTGARGPYETDHGQLVGYIEHRGSGKRALDLIATSHYSVAGRAALRLMASADPATMAELIRGYEIAKAAGILDEPASTMPSQDRGSV